MKKITLTQGKETIVDEVLYEDLIVHKWYFNNGYAVRKVLVDGKRVNWKMHWSIIGKPKSGLMVDHKNGNGLDNRKENLRVCSNQQNQWNRSKKKSTKTGYKGVNLFMVPNRKKDNFYKYFESKIVVSGKKIHLGLFKDVTDAAKAYDSAALEYFGKFARTNFVYE